MGILPGLLSGAITWQHSRTIAYLPQRSFNFLLIYAIISLIISMLGGYMPFAPQKGFYYGKESRFA